MLRSASTETASRSPAVTPSRSRRANVLFGLLLAAASVALWAGSVPSHAAFSSTLYAGFDADGNIRMTYADGTMIGTPNPPGSLVPAGTYTIDLNNNGLDDQAGEHYFHLFGPGVNLSAGNNLYDTVTWTATFQPGATYVYQDDRNPTTIHEVFGTPGSGAGTATTSTPTTTSLSSSSSGSKTTKPTSSDVVGSAIAPFRGTLLGSVTVAGKLTLTAKGRAVSKLKSGRYTFTINDSSARSGFTIQEIRKAAKAVTGVSFVGKHSVTIDLTPGQWFFYTTFVGKKTYFIVTA
jgi:hypothetical protein